MLFCAQLRIPPVVSKNRKNLTILTVRSPRLLGLMIIDGINRDVYRSLAGVNNKIWQIVPKLNYEKQLQNKTDEIIAEQTENQRIEDVHRQQGVRVTYGTVSASRNII